MEPALQKGGTSDGIDAFIAWEPFDAKAVGNGIGRYLIRSREIWPHHPCCVIAARAQFLEAHHKQNDGNKIYTFPEYISA